MTARLHARSVCHERRFETGAADADARFDQDLGAPCGVAHDFSLIPAEAYCYVLGLYLGDGCISRHRRVWRLRITLDKKYPAIIDRCRAALDTLMHGQHAGIVQRKG